MDITRSARKRVRAHQVHAVRITAPFEARWLDRIQSLSPGLQLEHWPADSIGAIPDDSWREVEILYMSFATPLPSPQQAPQLRWVQLYSAGIDQITDHPLFGRQVIVTTASGIHATKMAEYAFATVLAWFHRLPMLLEWQGRHQWPSGRERSTLFTGEELQGKTIGIVGYGSIGRKVARLACAFGLRVVATHRGADHRDHGFVLPGVGDPQGALPDRFFAPEQLHTLLSESDVVVVVVPLTPATRG